MASVKDFHCIPLNPLEQKVAKLDTVVTMEEAFFQIYDWSEVSCDYDAKSHGSCQAMVDGMGPRDGDRRKIQKIEEKKYIKKAKKMKKG